MTRAAELYPDDELMVSLSNVTAKDWYCAPVPIRAAMPNALGGARSDSWGYSEHAMAVQKMVADWRYVGLKAAHHFVDGG